MVRRLFSGTAAGAFLFCTLVAAGLVAGPAALDVSSDGSDGVLAPTEDLVIDLSRALEGADVDYTTPSSDPGDGTGGPGVYDNGSLPGLTYGTRTLRPLLGGSGGPGAIIGQQAGGGGGGAMLIAAGETISIGGLLSADGGGGNVGLVGSGPGSGGALRLIAREVAGTGSLRAVGSITRGAGDGAIRIEGETVDPSLNSLPPASAGDLVDPPILWPLPTEPSVCDD